MIQSICNRRAVSHTVHALAAPSRFTRLGARLRAALALVHRGTTPRSGNAPLEADRLSVDSVAQPADQERAYRLRIACTSREAAQQVLDQVWATLDHDNPRVEGANLGGRDHDTSTWLTVRVRCTPSQRAQLVRFVNEVSARDDVLRVRWETVPEARS